MADSQQIVTFLNNDRIIRLFYHYQLSDVLNAIFWIDYHHSIGAVQNIHPFIPWHQPDKINGFLTTILNLTDVPYNQIHIQVYAHILWICFNRRQRSIQKPEHSDPNFHEQFTEKEEKRLEQLYDQYKKLSSGISAPIFKTDKHALDKTSLGRSISLKAPYNMGPDYLPHYGNLDIKKRPQIPEFMGYGPTIQMTVHDHPTDPTRNIMAPGTVQDRQHPSRTIARWFIQTDPKLIISFPKALHITKEFPLWRAIRHPNRPGFEVMVPCGNTDRITQLQRTVLDRQWLESQPQESLIQFPTSYVWRDSQIAVLMAGHPRLKGPSKMGVLNPDLFRTILEYASPERY